MADTRDTILQELIRSVQDDAAIPIETKVKLMGELHAIPTVLQSDPWVYRMVVGSLGLTVLGTVIGSLIITGTSAQDIPAGVVALGSAAVGALAGLLAPSPTRG